MPISKSLNHDFFKKWSSEMAYVLGFFTADGCMIETKRGGKYLELYITDRYILTRIRTLFESEHKITLIRGDEHKKNRFRLQIGCQILYRDLLKLKLTPRKSLTIRMPLVPGKYFGDYLRGYFDGDGCVSLTKYWRKDREYWYDAFTTRFTSGSRLFLEDLWGRIDKYTFGGYLYEKSEKAFELVFSRKDSLAIFHLMYDNISSGLYLDRKYKIYTKAIKKLNLGT